MPTLNEALKNYEARILETQNYRSAEATADGICEACQKFHSLTRHENTRSPDLGQYLCARCLDWAERGDDVQALIDGEMDVESEGEEHA